MKRVRDAQWNKAAAAGEDRVVTRQKIIEVGREIGLESLSIKGIARRLNVTPAAIYKRVESRQALSLLLVDEIFSEVQAPEDEGNLRDYLLRVGCMLFNLYIDNPGFIECSADFYQSEKRCRFDLTIMQSIRSYGFRWDTADALYASIENLAMGMYLYVSRMQNILGRDYSIPAGPFVVDAKQTVALMFAPYVDGLLAYFSDPRDLK